MSYWYVRGAEGKDFCYAKEPTFICPVYRDVEKVTPDAIAGSGGPPLPPLGGALRRAAEMLGVDAIELRRWILNAHRHRHGRKRVEGKLTDRCAACDHRMERLGFRCWIEVEKPEAQHNLGDEITVAFGGTPTQTLKSLYVDTKREAQKWAREEARLSREIAKESDR